MLRAAAAERNAIPIANVLSMYLLDNMKLLEISSGTGQHIIKFAEKFPGVTFQPSEIDARSLHSIVAYIDHHRAAGVLLKRGSGLLITYGPYAIDGVISPQSNIDFDAGLRSQNPEWGLRDVSQLSTLASSCGLTLVARHNMPANNHMLIFSRDSQENDG
ncbi:hypothetical protein OESDEN_01123 [Oesophagostomum dentatum]|uniref:Methyltransferase domain protein n=1 Tax=Oesophagostomum dentatum TaxID=61180 RepID=A0A0B1TNN3_OESDE|nr:hypothetical protein OESDEN_01123 [Oesophagostomum dentatum]